jgi:hypothetical protein
VFTSYALVTHTSAKLFINPTKITPQVREHLGPEVEILPYEAIFSELQTLSMNGKVPSTFIIIFYLFSFFVSLFLFAEIRTNQQSACVVRFRESEFGVVQLLEARVCVGEVQSNYVGKVSEEPC